MPTYTLYGNLLWGDDGDKKKFLTRHNIFIFPSVAALFLCVWNIFSDIYEIFDVSFSVFMTVAGKRFTEKKTESLKLMLWTHARKKYDVKILWVNFFIIHWKIFYVIKMKGKMKIKNLFLIAKLFWKFWNWIVNGQKLALRRI